MDRNRIDELQDTLIDAEFDVVVITASGTGLSGDKSFTHNQGTASDTWTINHNLGKNPSVTVEDSAKTPLRGVPIYVDSNTLILRFSHPFSGKAFLN